MATVLIPAPYRGPTGGRDRIEATGGTIRACLEDLEARHAGFLPLVVDPATGGIHRFVKLVLNGKLLARDASVLTRPVGAQDELEILAAIGGG
jgi:hypothetical protein